MASYILDNGLPIMANRIKGGGTEPKYIGWGTGTATAAKADTGLKTPAAESRVAGTSSVDNTLLQYNTAIYQVVGAIVCSGAAKAITEVALYDALTGGTGFFRSNFAAINVSPGDSIEFTLKTYILNWD